MTVDIKKLFGRRLAAIRQSKGMKQHQLARLIGKKDTYITAIETGRNYPRPEMIPLLAKALDVPISALYFFEGIDDDPKLLRKQIESILQISDVSQLRKHFRHMIVSLEE